MQETKNFYYIDAIQADFVNRQSKNLNYSLRAYSRDIGIHFSSLSQILRGKRILPLKDASAVCSKLKLDDKERKKFLESLMLKKTKLEAIELEEKDDRLLVTEAYYKVIAEWEHSAALEIFELHDTEFNLKSISQKLGIEISRAKEVIKNLMDSSLIEQTTNGKYAKKHPHIKTSDGPMNKALRDSHRQTLKMSENAIDNVSVLLRNLSSLTIAIDLDRLEEAKLIIQEFRRKMIKHFEEGTKTEVYQLAIQLFPLSVINAQENAE